MVQLSGEWYKIDEALNWLRSRAGGECVCFWADKSPTVKSAGASASYQQSLFVFKCGKKY